MVDTPIRIACIQIEPRVDGRQERVRLTDEPKSPLNVPTSSCLHPRCPIAVEACQTMLQKLEEVERDHWISCLVVAKSRNDPMVLSLAPQPHESPRDRQ